MNPNHARLVLSMVLDIVDFTIGRVPGLEIVVDMILGCAAVAMWGWPGLFAFLEIADPTGQIDGFAPTLTLIALSQMGKAKKSAPTIDLPRSN